MKRVYKLFLLALLLVPLKVFAAGGFEVNPATITMKVGESKKFTVVANNAAGRLEVSSSAKDIASVDESEVFLDKDSIEITVTAKKKGTATITVLGTEDFATYDEEILDGEKKTITINVVDENEPQTPSDTPEDQTPPDEEKDNPGTGSFLPIATIGVFLIVGIPTVKYLNKKRLFKI